MWLFAWMFFLVGAGAAWLLLRAPWGETGFRLLAALGVTAATFAVAVALNRSLRRQIGERNAELQSELAQRRQREAELAHSEEQFRCVFDNIGEGIFLHDVETQRVLSVNRALCDLRQLRNSRKACWCGRQASSGEVEIEADRVMAVLHDGLDRRCGRTKTKRCLRRADDAV